MDSGQGIIENKTGDTQEVQAVSDEVAQAERVRAQALGRGTIEKPKLIMLPGGAIATEQEVEDSRNRGEEPSSGPYKNGIR